MKIATLILTTLVVATIAAPAQAGGVDPRMFIGLMQHMMPNQRPRQVAQAPFVATGSLPDGCSPQDIHAGGNCGTQAAGWCNTWAMMHRPLPPECFSRSVGTRGGYAQNGGRVYGNVGGRGQSQSMQTTITTWHMHQGGRIMLGGSPVASPSEFAPRSAPMPAQEPTHITSAERQLIDSIYK